MRPTTNKRRPKTRSSIRLCEEKFCCLSLDSTARFFCKDCNSDQCIDCEKSIHSRKLEYDFHIRDRIDAIPELHLCQGKKINISCTKRNFPDLWCLNCSLQLCFTCFDQFHSTGKKRSHKSVSFAYYQRKLAEQKYKKLQEECDGLSVSLEVHDSSDLYEDALSDCNMIKPQTPFSLADDSLTYNSFPQECDTQDINMAFTSSSENVFSDFTQTSHSHKGHNKSGTSRPDICMDTEINGAVNRIALEESVCEVKSFKLVDDQEILQVKNNFTFESVL